MTVEKKSKLPPAGHPVWAFVNTVAVCAFVTFYSYVNAQHFDESEVKLILFSTLSWIGVELFKARRPKGAP
ncbi:MAG: hypothetical protein AB7O38_29915 [Pirellulaceae bacterium]